MAEMGRHTVAAQLAVLVLVVAAAVAPIKSFEEQAENIANAAFATVPAESKTSYTIQAEGVIYCRCNLTGYLKPVDAAPLPGAVAILKCISTRNLYISKANANGYFLIRATLANKYLARYCKVFVSSPVRQCTVPRDYRLGGAGAKLTYERNLTQGKTTVSLYTAGFFQLGPVKSSLCSL